MQYSTLHNVDISIAFDKLPNTTMQSIQRCAISGKCNENNYNPFFLLFITSSQIHSYHCYILLITIVGSILHLGRIRGERKAVRLNVPINKRGRDNCTIRRQSCGWNEM